MNNSINTGPLADAAMALAGIDARALMSPATTQAVMNVARLSTAYYENLGMKWNGSAFEICGGDGTDLSPTNYAKVTLPSNLNVGRVITYTITANQGFIDSNGASTIIGSTFGTTPATAWTEQMPFFVYCAAKNATAPDTDPVFFISRIPHRQQLPNSATIGQAGDTLASTAGSVFALAPITASDYQNSSCVLMGSFRMVSKNASDDWNVGGLQPNDGFNIYKEQVGYNMPTGQFGATGYFVTAGGTVPDFGVQSSIGYSIQNNGTCYVTIILVNFGGGTPGAGTDTIQLTMPLPSPSPVPVFAVFWVNGPDFATAAKAIEIAQPQSSSWTVFAPGVGTNFNLTLDELNGDVRMLVGSFLYALGTD